MNLADKAILIQKGMWNMPIFDNELGFLLFVGDESISYEPSHLTFNADDYESPRDFLENSMTGNIFDPFIIQKCLSAWGQEYLDAAKEYVNY